MYSREDRMKAIELYIKYDKSIAAVVQELGYPSRGLLPRWYKAYLKEQETGVLWERYSRCPKFSPGQKIAAVEHYLEHGRNLSRTVKSLGYPSKEALRLWCDELAPKSRKKRVGGLQYSQEQKKEAVIALCTRTGNAKEIAREYGVTREALYNWKNDLLSKENSITMPEAEDKPLPDNKDALLSEIESLKRQIKGLKLEKAILEGTAEIIKKDPGVDPKHLTNKEKVILANALRNEYPLKEVLACLGMARSSYFYHRKLSSIPGKYEELRRRIIELFEENSGRYGYRRIHALLAREEIRISEKVVRRIMGESELVVFQKRRRKYSSYQGEETPGADNLIKRNFHADAPNIKWLTDITEFAIPAGKVYLSPIMDCFDGLLLSWSIGTSPDADLVNSMLDRATKTLKEGERPLVHSDRGGHYRLPGWISRMEKAGLQRSMSKKGCSPDNAACEGFFGRLKNEMFYNKSWVGVSLEEFIDILDGYMVWYNEKRIKLSLGAMSPLEYRQSLCLTA
ncbi:MAG TPA: IS3 family transposase [Firmicutes bacterium]|nr:IS3 family transposase [Bacillota bacterium]